MVILFYFAAIISLFKGHRILIKRFGQKFSLQSFYISIYSSLRKEVMEMINLLRTSVDSDSTRRLFAYSTSELYRVAPRYSITFRISLILEIASVGLVNLFEFRIRKQLEKLLNCSRYGGRDTSIFANFRIFLV